MTNICDVTTKIHTSSLSNKQTVNLDSSDKMIAVWKLLPCLGVSSKRDSLQKSSSVAESESSSDLATCNAVSGRPVSGGHILQETAANSLKKYT